MSQPKSPKPIEMPTEQQAKAHDLAHELAERLLMIVEVAVVEFEEDLDPANVVLAMEIATEVWRRELTSYGASKAYLQKIRKLAVSCSGAYDAFEDGAECTDPSHNHGDEAPKNAEASVNVVVRKGMLDN